MSKDTNQSDKGELDLNMDVVPGTVCPFRSTVFPGQVEASPLALAGKKGQAMTVAMDMVTACRKSCMLYMQINGGEGRCAVTWIALEAATRLAIRGTKVEVLPATEPAKQETPATEPAKQEVTA